MEDALEWVRRTRSGTGERSHRPRGDRRGLAIESAKLIATAKHRALDHFRRSKMLDRRHEDLSRQVEFDELDPEGELHAPLDDFIGDDLLRLIFTTCHPVLGKGRRTGRKRSSSRSASLRSMATSGITNARYARWTAGRPRATTRGLSLASPWLAPCQPEAVPADFQSRWECLLTLRGSNAEQTNSPVRIDPPACSFRLLRGCCTDV